MNQKKILVKIEKNSFKKEKRPPSLLVPHRLPYASMANFRQKSPKLAPPPNRVQPVPNRLHRCKKNIVGPFPHHPGTNASSADPPQIRVVFPYKFGVPQHTILCICRRNFHFFLPTSPVGGTPPYPLGPYPHGPIPPCSPGEHILRTICFF